MHKIQRALISVSDKRGLAALARELHALKVEIISTGGTARMLRESEIPVRDVSDVTGFPEMLDGRVKTLHPKIAGGLLAIRANTSHMEALEQHGIGRIDMVVVNLYPFENVASRPDVSFEELIENIDIGGPTMVRAAAKNFQDVAVVTSPDDYPAIIEELTRTDGELTRETKWKLAKKAFGMTAAYDCAIHARLEQVGAQANTLPDSLLLNVPKVTDLRYGENPHQSAALYASGTSGVAGGEKLHGKELSYNNLVDLDAAWQLASEFSSPAAIIIKHTNPCGAAEQATLAEAYRKAFECDPLSAYGGVIGMNRTVDEETATEIVRTFIEAIAAPGYTPGALALLTAKKNLRLMRVSGELDPLVVKSISGGFLAQTADHGRIEPKTAIVKTQRAPTDEEWKALDFAWKIAKHVKSNAIVYARAGQTVGVGAGQMSRVDSAKIGAMKAVLPLAATVVASDAFFPFPDGLEEACKHGATAFIQPGGSVHDADVIAAADRLGVAMVFTGMRHFRH